MRTATMLGRANVLERNSLGLVWLICPYPLIDIGLEAALKDEVRVQRIKNLQAAAPQGTEEPICVVICSCQDDLPQVMSRLKILASGVPVMVVGLSNDALLARSALRKGARGFVHVGMQPSQLRRALSMVRTGELVVPREIITDLVRQEDPVDILVLTPRQREILHLVTEGLTNAQIAQKLFLSEYTIKQHLRGAFRLLGVRNRTEAARSYKNLQEN